MKASKVVTAQFRKPAWCPKMDVEQSKDGLQWVLTFDMNPRVVDGPAVTVKKEGWHYGRYQNSEKAEKLGLQDMYRTTSAATVWNGPLLLAKCRRTGATTDSLLDLSTVNGKGYSVKLTPCACEGVWAAWDVELTKPGAPTIKTRACDYQSAADDPFGKSAVVFSVWF
ncbi:MAG: hypothetical protein RBU24_00350 [Kiritimatiellia bacterium]|nr:hypothetical protein [Kiritimatiellia bacterium]